MVVVVVEEEDLEGVPGAAEVQPAGVVGLAGVGLEAEAPGVVARAGLAAEVVADRPGGLVEEEGVEEVLVVEDDNQFQYHTFSLIICAFPPCIYYFSITASG